MRRSVSDDHNDHKMIVYVTEGKEGRAGGGKDGRAGGVGRDGSQKTRTPHRDVGNNNTFFFVTKAHLF